MSTTKIEWATKVWNPITGCTKVSRGCWNCYAERFAKRLQKNPKTSKYAMGFDVTFHEDELTKPMLWKKPERIFVCSMGDLFHENVPFEIIEAVFSVMSDIDRHTFIILTKRPERMYDFYNWKSNRLGFTLPYQTKDNVWIGVTAENQEQADIRIPILLQIPSTKKFVSCEPMLGEIDLWLKYLPKVVEHRALENGKMGICWEENKGLNWVIAGGETGPDVRPMHPEWIRSLRDQCISSNVPFFFKGWGNYIPLNVSLDGIKPIRSKHNTYWKNKNGDTFELIDEDGEFLVAGNNHEDYQQVKWVSSSENYTRNKIDGQQYHEFPKL